MRNNKYKTTKEWKEILKSLGLSLFLFSVGLGLWVATLELLISWLVTPLFGFSFSYQELAAIGLMMAYLLPSKNKTTKSWSHKKLRKKMLKGTKNFASKPLLFLILGYLLSLIII